MLSPEQNSTAKVSDGDFKDLWKIFASRMIIGCLGLDCVFVPGSYLLSLSCTRRKFSEQLKVQIETHCIGSLLENVMRQVSSFYSETTR